MIYGILLAAGSSTRFGHNKLMQPLPDGRSVFAASLDNLRLSVPQTLVIVAASNPDLQAELTPRANTEFVVCRDAHLGVGHSLACGVRASAGASGWLIALADMPFVRPATVTAVVAALNTGASIAVPVHDGRRGHPVGFARRWGEHLLQCHGDHGAAWILSTHREQVIELPCMDPGVCRDIDTPDDLAAPPPFRP
ncbi:MAG: hypothetical protein AMJ69_02010 [Gammaproteobacteria bacterium SG8_47]|nr:MAG: hypothetical protein AMJ69_02010 [Gammaproteobacteria bacterium SG8_47]